MRSDLFAERPDRQRTYCCRTDSCRYQCGEANEPRPSRLAGGAAPVAVGPMISQLSARLLVDGTPSCVVCSASRLLLASSPPACRADLAPVTGPDQKGCAAGLTPRGCVEGRRETDEPRFPDAILNDAEQPGSGRT